MAIPIRNIYYLLCYAWDHVEQRDLVPVGADAGDRVENLLAQVMCQGVGHLLRQGLDHGYISTHQELAGIRGKLLVGESVKRLLLPVGRASCQFDELTIDVPHNRIVKAALKELLAFDTVDLALRGQLRRLLVRFDGVSDIELEPRAFLAVRLHRNIARYGFLLDVCALIARSMFPDPITGERRFHPFTASDQAMGTLFEDFLFQFFKLEQDEFRVDRRKFKWNASATPDDLAWLPEMRTDVLLTSSVRRVVVEAKFYRQPLHYRGAAQTPKLISGHLYQLLAYLERLAVDEAPAPEGVLVYASPGKTFDLRYVLSGHQIRVVTLDLDQPWPTIYRAARRLVHQGP